MGRLTVQVTICFASIRLFAAMAIIGVRDTEEHPLPDKCYQGQI